MKRSNIQTKVTRHHASSDVSGNSRYAQKAKAGNQMYGDGRRPGKGCCANSHLFGFPK